MPVHHRGRVVLVGDAGYAAGPTGCGTSLAMAGAYILAGELGKHEHVDAALRSYEEKITPLIKDMQKIPPFVNTFLAPQTAWGLWIRNHLFALVAWTGIAELLQKFFGGGFGNAQEYPLPEYNWKRDP